MNNWIGPTVKHVWNNAMRLMWNIWVFDINSTAFRLGRYSLHLLLQRAPWPPCFYLIGEPTSEIQTEYQKCSSGLSLCTAIQFSVSFLAKVRRDKSYFGPDTQGLVL